MPDSLKIKYPEVPWRYIAGLRDKVVHCYFGIDLGVVWNTVIDDTPSLRPLITKILDETKTRLTGCLKITFNSAIGKKIIFKGKYILEFQNDFRYIFKVNNINYPIVELNVVLRHPVKLIS